MFSSFEPASDLNSTTRCCRLLMSFPSRASDLQNRVATQCLQLHGGWGYMWEYPIAKYVVHELCNREDGENFSEECQGLC